MNALVAALLVAVGYLSGSVSFAIIITRLVSGTDIRTLGNRNAGTANVGRSIGRGWATVVFFADVAKAVLPMFAARRLLAGIAGGTIGDASAHLHLLVVLVGIAAVLGHCRPLYFGFRGGGGIAATFGAIAFVTPVEFAFSMISGYLLVALLVHGSEYRYGRWTSGVITLVTPLVVTASALFPGVPISGSYRIGGHPWYVVAGCWMTIGFVILMNSRLYAEYIRGLFRRPRD